MLLKPEEQTRLKWCLHNAQLLNGVDEAKKGYDYEGRRYNWRAWSVWRGQLFIQWLEDYKVDTSYFKIHLGKLVTKEGWFFTSKKMQWTVVSALQVVDGPWWDFIREEIPKMEQEIKNLVVPPLLSGEGGELSIIEKK